MTKVIDPGDIYHLLEMFIVLQRGMRWVTFSYRGKSRVTVEPSPKDD